jgi:predicted RNA-binding Zn-ribbon protein involved in translation (DUF1610 family)
VHCHAVVVTDSSGAPLVVQSPNELPTTSYGPAQFQTAYGVVAQAVAPTTAVVALVDAYDNPNAKSDLDTYDSANGLPAFPSCAAPPASNAGCFREVNQTGGSSLPPPNVGWGAEIDLQAQAVHAMCPNCGILVVEASSNSSSNLLVAEDYATAHASVVTDSWGTAEDPSETTMDSHFNKPGIAITVASGDNGYGVEYPAASPYVTAVGGTTLTLTGGNTRANETVWGGAGSGCSAYEPKPSWQADSGCLMRTVADVAADADPNTGAAVYDSYGYGGWTQFGGTGLAASLVAAVYALAGPTVPGSYPSSYPYLYPGSLFDVTSGTNGTCGGSYLCTAAAGYDGPTGLGAPNGTRAFSGLPPTAATVVSFTARQVGAGVVLRWRLAQEVGAVGFNVYRRRAGTRTRLNRRLIAASAGPSDGDHVWRDRTAGHGSTYFVEAVHIDGSRTLLGPARPV